MNGRWVYVCATSELLPGEYRSVHIEGMAIAVFNYEGTFYALEDLCTHDGGELTGGLVEGPEVECPRHGARFDLRTGAALCPPAYVATRSFPVKVEGQVVYARLADGP